MPMVPGAGWAEVGEDVAEEVGGDHHVEAVGVEDEVRGEDVDVIFVPGDAGEGFAISCTRSSQ
jgi:hypothetical protein